MKRNNIKLLPVKGLNGKSFFVPNYQRGYCWTEKQVCDLLDDVMEFMKKTNRENHEIYCLQPLVVKKRYNNKEYHQSIKKFKEVASLEEAEDILHSIPIQWEVIDGQQRLTTIHIILSVLQEKIKECTDISYELTYETREKTSPGTKIFLENIATCQDRANDNADYFHMYKAYETIQEWFNKKTANDTIADFAKTFIEKVHFIWYETDEPNPINVFTRLNIGKIALTDAELVKALFLNRNNFICPNTPSTYENIIKQQQEIAAQWDKIEFALQNDEFWLFIHDNSYHNPTRIDYILELLRENDNFKIDEKFDTADHRIFRYFQEGFKKQFSSFLVEKTQMEKDNWLQTTWHEVESIFQIFQEWYNDLELYHYIGFLIATTNSISMKTLLNYWHDCTSKEKFIEMLKSQIKKTINAYKDLNKQYEVDDNHTPKTRCKSLLLLHNIQTVINQNQHLTENEEYKLPIFYKFPFHLYKKENWDIEHIHSSTPNNIDETETQCEFLLNCYLACDDNTIKSDIQEFISNPQEKKYLFDKILHEFKKKNLIEDDNDDNLWDEKLKNQICNFVLLDASTNRSYGNAIFPAKRRIIIGKDMGKYIPIPKLRKKEGKFSIEIETKEIPAQSAFVPPCTKQVFLKYYSPVSSHPTTYSVDDAEAYRKNIAETLKQFDVTIEKEI